MNSVKTIPPAVIFDFDGVIVDSLGSHLKAWELACVELFQITPAPELMLSVVGRSTTAIARILSMELGKGHQAEQLADKKRKLISNDYSLIELLPGVREYMKCLGEQNIPFGIASNAPRAFVKALGQAHKLPVNVMMGVEDAQRPKPAPDLFLACAQKLGVSVLKFDDVFVFEDSTHGIEAAVSAGMVPIGVRTQHADDVLRSAGAKHTVENLMDAVDQRLGLNPL